MTAPRSHPNPRIHPWWLSPGVQRAGLWYRLMRTMLQATMPATWKIRVFNRHYEPDEGSAVYICNHQSFLDPMLVGMALRRPMNYMARDSLFRFPVFGRMIESVNAFPVRRGTADAGAMKESIRRLKGGGQVVVFAEGTRTSDGRIGPFLPGVAMLARRAAAWTVPAVIDGAFECWPRWRALPVPGNIVVQYGRPIPQEQARAMEPRQLLEQVRRTIIEMQTDVRRRVGRPALSHDHRTPEPLEQFTGASIARPNSVES